MPVRWSATHRVAICAGTTSAEPRVYAVRICRGDAVIRLHFERANVGDGAHLAGESCAALTDGTVPGGSWCLHYISPDAILIVSASTIVLKKNDSTLWTSPARRVALVSNDTSAVCPDVPMIAAA